MGSSSEGRGKRSRRRRRILSGISTNVLALGVVSLLTDMSSEMIYPLLPFFLLSIGATATMIGLIEGAAESTASFLKVVSGWYSDRYRRRRPFVIGGYTESSLVKPFMYIVTAPWNVLAWRVVERVGKGVRSAPRDALIADSTAYEVRGKAFGFHKMMDSVGAVAGPLLALAVLLYAASVSMGEPDNYRLVFLLAPIPAFIGVAVILLYVKEREGDTSRREGRFLKDMRLLGRPFWRLLAVVMVFYAGSLSWAFLLLRAEYAGSTVVESVLMYVMLNVTYVLVPMPAGVLSDRIGRRPLVMLSLVLFMLSCVIMALSDSTLLFAAGFIAYGAFMGTSEGVLKAYVVDVVPRDLRGTALGTLHTAQGFVMLPGAVVAGLLWDTVGYWATFAYGIVMALVALVLLVCVCPEERKRTHGRPGGP